MEIKLEREQGSNFLVACDDKLDFNSYQIQMLINNKIKGVLNTSVRIINMEQKMYFDITSKQSLSQLLEIRQLGSSDILKLIKDLISIIEELKNYIIGEDVCVFSPQFIYVEPDTLLPSICVIPKIEENGITELMNTFLDMVSTIDSEDKMAYCLYRFAKGKDNTIHNLNKIIESSYSENMTDEITNGDDKYGDYQSIDDKKSLNILEKVNDNQTLSLKENIHERWKSDIVDEGISQAETRGQEILFKLRMNKSACIGGSLLIFAIIILLMNILCFKDENGIINIKVCAIVNFTVLITMGAIIYFISYLLDKEKDGNMEEDEDEFVPVFEFIDNTIADMKVNVEPCFTQFIKINTKENIQMLLIDMETGLRHKIEEDTFIIGKIAGTVNLRLDNPVVSRIHAQLSKREGEVYIQDLNSKNGTYVEGVRLEPGEQRKLTNNEIITIAEEEFRFQVIYNNPVE